MLENTTSIQNQSTSDKIRETKVFCDVHGWHGRGVALSVILYVSAHRPNRDVRARRVLVKWAYVSYLTDVQQR